MNRAPFIRRNLLPIGVALFAITGFADARLTLAGFGGDLGMEANPLARASMIGLGPGIGPLAQKALVGCIAILIAMRFERAIRDLEPWIWKVPSSTWSRRWMQEKERSWIAFLPLYGASAGQALATALWLLVAVPRFYRLIPFAY
jgi:hypothetical protein